MIHGRIQHGFQYLDPDKRLWPTTYYGPTSGIGMAIDHHPAPHATDPERTLRIGVVGLGCGTLAAYGQPGDYVRFYEINPEVVRISRRVLHLSQGLAGQGRDRAGRRADRDGAARWPRASRSSSTCWPSTPFSSDSIPMHLLTTECVELFREHLKPDGLLCIHISNRFLDLGGVVRRHCRGRGLASACSSIPTAT